MSQQRRVPGGVAWCDRCNITGEIASWRVSPRLVHCSGRELQLLVLDYTVSLKSGDVEIAYSRFAPVIIKKSILPPALSVNTWRSRLSSHATMTSNCPTDPKLCLAHIFKNQREIFIIKVKLKKGRGPTFR